MYSKIFSILLLLFWTTTQGQSIAITEQTTFHDATWGTFGDLEDVSVEDEGGVLYVFVKNLNNQLDTIADIEISQGSINAQIEGWRAWPPVMQGVNSGNNISVITLKSIKSPIAENNPITIKVTTTRGNIATKNFFCQTPKLRLANVLPSQDQTRLFIYLRNDSPTDTFVFNSLTLNQKNYILQNNELRVLSNKNEIGPKEVVIYELNNTLPMDTLMPLAIGVSYKNKITNDTMNIGAGIRLVPAEFYVGTWHSSLLNTPNQDVRIRNRRLRLSNLFGAGDFNLMEDAYRQFFIKNVKEAPFGNPFDVNNALPEISSAAHLPSIRYWFLDDEPDLSNKPMSEQMAKNEAYWLNDANTPTFVNLAAQKKFSLYGWLPDVVSMDHYAAADAPNVIPLTWVPVIGRPGDIREALEYTEYLKKNTEPRRMTSWCQFEANTWGSDPREQPRDFALNYQFWAHVAGGAKAIDFFVVQDKDENVIPEQYNEALKVTQQIAPIQNAILYSEPSDNIVAIADSGKSVSAKMLVGPESITLIVLNDNIQATPDGAFWNTTIDSTRYRLEVNLPQTWNIKPFKSIVKVLPDGSFQDSVGTFNYQILPGSNKLIIEPNEAIYNSSHVYFIHLKQLNSASELNDPNPALKLLPQKVSGLQIVEQTDDYHFTLSWQEPYDILGIKGYWVRYNGMIVDTVYSPIYVVNDTDSSYSCAGGIWGVQAFNALGYSNEADTLQITPANISNTDSVDFFYETMINENKFIIYGDSSNINRSSFSREFFSNVNVLNLTIKAFSNQATDFELLYKSTITEVYIGSNIDTIEYSQADWLHIDRNSSGEFFTSFPGVADKRFFGDINLEYFFSGFYDVYFMVIARNACHADTAFFKFNASPENVVEKSNPFNLSVSPNPSNDRFFYSMDNIGGKDIQLALTDMLGQVVFQKELKSSEHPGKFQGQFSLQQYPPGIYLLRVQSGEVVRHVRLMKY